MIGCTEVFNSNKERSTHIADTHKKPNRGPVPIAPKVVNTESENAVETEGEQSKINYCDSFDAK